MLASGAAGAVGVDAQILRGDVKLRLLRLGQHGHGGGGGMDASAALRLRHTLDAVGAALKLESGIHPGALYGESGLLHAAQLRVAAVDHIRLPAAAISIEQVHTKKVGGKQSPLFPAHTGSNLQDRAAVIVRIPGQEQKVQLLCQSLLPLLGPVQLLPGQVVHLRVGEHGLRLLPGAAGPAKCLIRPNHRGQLLLLPGQIPQTKGVCVHLRLGQEQLHLLQTQGGAAELIFHHTLSQAQGIFGVLNEFIPPEFIARVIRPQGNIRQAHTL